MGLFCAAISFLGRDFKSHFCCSRDKPVVTAVTLLAACESRAAREERGGSHSATPAMYAVSFYMEMRPKAEQRSNAVAA